MASRRLGLALAVALGSALAMPAALGSATAVAGTETGVTPAESGAKPDSAGRSKKHERAKPSGQISLFSVNHREQVTANIYGPDGDFDDAALAKLDLLFRCKRSGRVRAVDPRLYEILAHVYEHFGKVRVELISGFRYRERSSSRHFHGAAMDIRVPGVSYRKLAKFVESLDTGNMGVGRYPTSKFVHVDIRAPGTRSYRWVDYSGSESGKRKSKQRERRTKPSKRKLRPTS